MNIEIERWSTDRLREYKNNSRIHSEDQVSEVANSIKEFGFVNPILVDENDTIIAGHCRLRAAKNLGMEEVPVVVLAHLDPEQRIALTIADNKSSCLSTICVPVVTSSGVGIQRVN